MEVVFISGIFMSFFIVILLLTKRHKTITDKILAVWIAVIGMHLLGYYFNQIDYWEIYPHLIGVTVPIPLFHGPLLYLYCLYALRNDNNLRCIDYLHFAPGIISYIYMLKFFFFYTPDEKIMVDKGEMGDYRIFSLVLLGAIFISGISYSILSYRLTMRYKQKIKNQFSYHEGISLSWLRYCILSIGLVFLMAIIVFVLRDALEVRFPFNPEYIFYTIMIVFIFYIGYFGIKRENIFTSNAQPEMYRKEKQTDSFKYKNSGLTEEVTGKLYKELLRVMEVNKPYLQPKLTLSELAAQLEITTNQLSQIINQQAGNNFHDFVNAYRVEEFLKNSQKNKSYNLLSLAFDSGFNSKSSFNTIFKKQKGLSPSQYLAKIEQTRVQQ